MQAELTSLRRWNEGFALLVPGKKNYPLPPQLFNLISHDIWKNSQELVLRREKERTNHEPQPQEPLV